MDLAVRQESEADEVLHGLGVAWGEAFRTEGAKMVRDVLTQWERSVPNAVLNHLLSRDGPERIPMRTRAHRDALIILLSARVAGKRCEWCGGLHDCGR
jgi:hypothetical protein